MLKLSLRGLLAHKLRFVTTTFAVVLGVAFVVGALVVTDTLRSSVGELFSSINEGIDISVRAETNLSGGGGPASRGRVPEDLVEVVRTVDGVASAEGVVSGYAQMLDEDGEPTTTTGAPFLGVSWGENDDLYPVTIDEGRKPEGPDEVAIDRDTSDEYGLDVGDRTAVLLVEGQRPVQVVGVFTFGETNSLLGARLTAFDAEVAPAAFGIVGEFDTIDIGAEPGVDAEELSEQVQAELPEGFEAVTQQAIVDESEDQVGVFLDVFQTALLGFAGVALFVSAFYINNTFSIVLGQRTRELSLLRSLGASTGQVTASVLIEALLVGVVASAVGIGAGLLIAVALQGILAAGGFELPDEALALTGRTFGAALIVGVGVTLASAVSPARQAGRVPPMAGMLQGYRSPEPSRRRWLAGGGLVAVGLALGLLGLFVIDRSMLIFTSLVVGALAVFLGIALLSPLLAEPVVGALGRPFAALFRISGRLARANAVRNPHRTAKTASALMVGLALVTMVSVVGASLKESFAASVADAVTADYVVSTESFTGFSPDVVTALQAEPDIDRVTGVRFDRFIFEGAEKDLAAIDPDTAFELVDVDVQAGSPGDLAPGTIFVHEDPAGDLGLEVGDTVTVEFADGGPRDLQVAGIHADSTYAGNYLVDLDTFDEGYPANDLDMLAFATVVDGVDPAAARPAIERALEPFPQLTLEDRVEFNESQQSQVDQILLAVNALLGLALVIALLGIANTLALSVIERVREIGVLRAVGMTRGQTRLMVMVESVVVAAFGAFLGIVIGLLFGLGAASAMPESVITIVTVPFGTLIGIAVVAMLCGVIAGLLPARRAARLDVLEAIAHE
jgi:putative ABC transport system permease protein